MGELEVEGSNGSAEQRQNPGLEWNCYAPPDPASLSEESWSVAEAAAQQLLSCIHPTRDSEEERRDIIDYVVRLIKSHLNCEVFPFGSVPLKTFLPDGDIDLTVINAGESLVHDVLAILQMEQKNAIAEFKVKDTQYIDAEVKLVKCLVRNTIIDISFNQLGGLSTLCFLEQVDLLVGRNHLFKRSIILIKAWCYYESRILGANHGLISTYALETLVLYIFQLYHSSLCGPLAVLYRFLEYYSKFDWDNYCISLKGPVCKSSLPDIVVKVLENRWNDLMFSEEFMENCMEMFSVSSRALEGKPKAFQRKNLNIIDPLKENNNLGRSVHIGNFYRIRSSFKYGARKLGQVFSLPCDKIATEIHKFFSNAIARHGSGMRNRFLHMALEFSDEVSLTASIPSPVKFTSEEILIKSSVNDDDGVELESKNEMELPLKTGSEGWYTTGVNSGHHVAVDTCDVITSSSSLKEFNNPYYMLHRNYSSPLSWNNCHQPFCHSKSSVENGSLENGNFRKNDLVDSVSLKYDIESQWEDSKEHSEVNNINHRVVDSSLVIYTTNLGSSVTMAHNVEDISLDSKDLDFTTIGNSEAFNYLADLRGDYDSHIRSLLYGQLCNGFSLSAVGHLPPLWCHPFSEMTICSLSREQSNCRAAHSAPPAYSFYSEAQKEGNGSLGERHPQRRSRKKVSECHDGFNRHERSYPASAAQNRENPRHEVPEKRGSHHQRRDIGKCSSVGSGNQTADGDLSGSWRIEFGSIGNLAREVTLASADMGGSTKSRRATPKQERSVGGNAIHLKNEAQFPRLGL